MQLVLIAIGATLFTVGVAFIYWPAALVCLGVIVALVGLRMPPDAPHPPSASTQR